VAERIEIWAPRHVVPTAGTFARKVVVSAEPPSWPRARSLLWAASRLCAFALDCGLEPEPSVVLSRSVIERFIVVGSAGWSGPGRRTLRSNLLFLAQRVLDIAPDPVPLGRERAQAPYSEAELAAYLDLADAQPTVSRRARASGLIALGAGAGLIGTDLRLVTGHHVIGRSGGVVVEVGGRRPRVVPVRRELAPRALRAAAWAGPGFIVGGAEPHRRNVTSPLIASLAGGADLPRLSLARLRSTWLSRCAADIGLPTFMAAAGVTCSQRLGDVVADLEVGDEERAVALLGGVG
jgi:integrase